MAGRRDPLRPWAVAAGVALVAATFWLRVPSVPYLAVAGAATLLAAAALPGVPPAPRRWTLVWLLPTLGFCVLAARVARERWRLERGWPAYAAALRAEGRAALRAEVAASAGAAAEVASIALAAPADPDAAFAHLAAAVRGRGGIGVVLYRDGRAAAWAGELRVEPGAAARPLAATFTPFYLALHRQASRGPDRAVATALVSAVPPADRIATTLDEAAADKSGVDGFEFSAAVDPDAVGPGAFPVAVGREVLFTARVIPPTPAAVRLRLLERARLSGAALIAAGYTCFVLVLWRLGASLRRRLLVVATGGTMVALAPWNELSNASQLFDPSFYYAALGGPFTASVVALGLSGALALAGLLATLRSRIALPRWAALFGALAVAGVAPYLLRALARGIALPIWGVTTRLWLAWEVTIFLAAAAVLLAGASFGRAALGGSRGLPAWVAPTLAALAAVLAPVLWEAPGRWPRGYAALWIAAVTALALARRHRAMVLTAATVAGCGAATVVWGATARKRVDLAARDVAALSAPDPYARELLERFSDDLLGEAAPTSRAGLLRRYAESDLAAAGYTAALVRWDASGTRGDSLLLAPVGASEGELHRAVAAARAAARANSARGGGAAGGGGGGGGGPAAGSSSGRCSGRPAFKACSPWRTPTAALPR